MCLFAAVESEPELLSMRRCVAALPRGRLAAIRSPYLYVGHNVPGSMWSVVSRLVSPIPHDRPERVKQTGNESGQKRRRRLGLAAGAARGARGDVEQPVLLGCLPCHRPVDLAALGQHLQRPDRDGGAVDVEEATGGCARVGETEAVGAERDEVPRHPWGDLVLNGAHVVGYRDDRPWCVLEPLGHERHPLLLVGVEEGPFVTGHG